MSPCRPRLLLVLLSGLAAMALSVAGHAESEHSSPRARADAAFTSQGAGIDSSVARLTGKERRDGTASQRLLTQRSMLFTISVLLALPVLGGRRVPRLASVRGPDPTWWLTRSSRAPPAFFPS